MNMADRIKQRMQEIGMTQDQLATQVGFTQPAIFKLLSGKTKRTTRLAEIAQALEVRPEWLATGAGEKDLSPDATSRDQAFLSAYKMLPEDEREAMLVLVFRRLKIPLPSASPSPSPSPSASPSPSPSASASPSPSPSPKRGHRQLERKAG